MTVPAPAGPPPAEPPGFDRPLGEKLVGAVRSTFPGYDPQRRPVHTLGVAVGGVFRPAAVARQWCRAEHFARPEVAVTVRFSNGSGVPVRHDGWSDARGMATRFHLAREAEGFDTDLIAMTLGSFFSGTVPDFLAFCEAAVPKPVQPPSGWQQLLGMLRLVPAAPPPPPGQLTNGAAGMLDYANRHRPAQPTVVDAATIGAPVSYARASYHAVHTFIATGADGAERPVRFTWQPVSGVASTDPQAVPVDDYLVGELKQRLARWPTELVLMMTIGEHGDALDDPTRPWPMHRQRVAMGNLWLQRVLDDELAEKIAFNPCRLVPGLKLSGDPILAARLSAYEVSREWRGGRACPFHPGT